MMIDKPINPVDTNSRWIGRGIATGKKEIDYFSYSAHPGGWSRSFMNSIHWMTTNFSVETGVRHIVCTCSSSIKGRAGSVRKLLKVSTVWQLAAYSSSLIERKNN
ncbi:hypothetical protein VTO42DRAFT_2773 [Malbranchea cinnamomea]